MSKEKDAKAQKTEFEQIGADQEAKQTTETPAEVEPDAPQEAKIEERNQPKKSVLRRAGSWIKTHKKISIPVGLLLVLFILSAVPATRYGIARSFIEQQFTVEVIDSETKKPVTSAAVILGGQEGQTDSKGRVTLKGAVGHTTLEISKNYYKRITEKVIVPILKQKNIHKVAVQATGRQVEFVVLHKITGKPVEGALVSGANTEAKTDKNGQAILVVATDVTKVSATVTAKGFNSFQQDIEVKFGEPASNTFNLVPSGKLYFLSNKSGKVDVVKVNLDGSDRKVVLAGTGKEDKRNTTMLASRDWRYLALHSKKDGGDHAKLFLIDTSTDQVVVMDEGSATFGLVGWSNHRFVYKVYREGYKAWQSGGTVLKSYDAPSKKITKLDQSEGEGNGSYDYANEEPTQVYILPNDELFYAKSLYFGTIGAQNGVKHAGIYTIKADGSGKKTLKTYDRTAYPGEYGGLNIGVRPYGANGTYVSLDFTKPVQFFEYEDGKLSPTTEVNSDSFYESYPTYLLSPSGRRTFWSESRDGKNTLFVGNDEGKEGKQIAAPDEYQVYGWYTEDYLLVSKKSSELYILPAQGGTPLKLTDYYKPEVSYYGYGSGYGGL